MCETNKKIILTMEYYKSHRIDGRLDNFGAESISIYLIIKRIRVSWFGTFFYRITLSQIYILLQICHLTHSPLFFSSTSPVRPCLPPSTPPPPRPPPRPTTSPASVPPETFLGSSAPPDPLLSPPPHYGPLLPNSPVAAMSYRAS
jgi:hypothetical protein